MRLHSMNDPFFDIIFWLKKHMNEKDWYVVIEIIKMARTGRHNMEIMKILLLELQKNVFGDKITMYYNYHYR